MINIAELLKDAPEGIKLYSPLFGEVKLKCANLNITEYPIAIIAKNGDSLLFDKYGRYFNSDRFPDGECLLFPSKDYRTWQGWTPCVEPKFKVGDKALDDMKIVTVKDVVYDQKYKEYRYSVGSYWVFESALKPYKSHYDTANFHAGMPVLVRDGDSDDDEWTYALFSHYSSNRTAYKFSASGDIFRQCIPYNDETKHLLGTTDMPSEEFINW